LHPALHPTRDRGLKAPATSPQTPYPKNNLSLRGANLLAGRCRFSVIGSRLSTVVTVFGTRRSAIVIHKPMSNTCVLNSDLVVGRTNFQFQIYNLQFSMMFKRRQGPLEIEGWWRGRNCRGKIGAAGKVSDHRCVTGGPKIFPPVSFSHHCSQEASCVPMLRGWLESSQLPQK
jgi:hypothetical protein